MVAKAGTGLGPADGSTRTEISKANDSFARAHEQQEASSSASRPDQIPAVHQSTIIAQPQGPAEMMYSEAHQKDLEKIDAPWDDDDRSLTCDPRVAFESNCHPRPATCRSESEYIATKHGIGNALIVSLVTAAQQLLKDTPDCAPILRYSQLRDFMREPTVVVGNSDNKKCVIYSITQPQEAVATKVAAINSLYYDEGESAAQHLPLLSIQIRTGWGDEQNRNMNAWDALGDCSEYKEQFTNMHHKAVSEINVQEMLTDAALAADRAFGVKQWRAYIASDAPGIRQYAKQVLESRATGRILWVEGAIGHNAVPGATMTQDEKTEIAINAFVDIIMMSSAHMLISINSKFPKAANMRSMCPQRFTELRGHPRHGLADSGGILTKSLDKRPRGDDIGKWVPELSDGEKETLFASLPDGDKNMCTQAPDPIRACFCLKKLSHSS